MVERMQKENLHIWLSYVSYPVTTAAYIERALRKKYKVTTIGPQLPPQLIEAWDLKNLKLPILPQNIACGFDVDFSNIFEEIPTTLKPDVYLWVESVHGYFPKNIKALGAVTACYLIDSHLNLEIHLEWAKHFDFVFIAQLEYVPIFRERSNPNTFWLPLAADETVHAKRSNVKKYDVGFVGSINSSIHNRRKNLLDKINSYVPVAYKRCFDSEMAEFFSESKIVFNNAIKNDLNMRVFETLSIGSMLLTDRTIGNGQEEMFKDGEDLVVYEDDEIVEKVKYYLEHDEEREKIARRGYEISHAAHTYFHRVEELLDVVIGNKNETKTPEEWRHLSEKESKKSFPVAVNSDSRPKRSIIIPVLDMSPSSNYNIETLLKDLEKVEGEVIVVFNSQEMYEKFKTHKRIDEYAVMKHNVGVSRAWNIGLDIARGKISFILNSDLKVEPEAFDQLQNFIENTPDAAMVGVQGSYLNFQRMKIIQYFEKGTFNEPIKVDEVSGFFFAVKTELFNSNVLHFDNQYTPCYSEEWDIALQIKSAGFSCYIVPANGYDHKWGGSIGSLYREIEYYDRKELAKDILTRNREKFNKKWTAFAELTNTPDLLISYWVEIQKEKLEKAIEIQDYNAAKEIIEMILKEYPNHLETHERAAEILFRLGNIEGGLKFLEEIQKFNPDYKIDLNKFSAIGEINQLIKEPTTRRYNHVFQD